MTQTYRDTSCPRCGEPRLLLIRCQRCGADCCAFCARGDTCAECLREAISLVESCLARPRDARAGSTPAFAPPPRADRPTRALRALALVAAVSALGFATFALAVAVRLANLAEVSTQLRPYRPPPALAARVSSARAQRALPTATPVTPPAALLPRATPVSAPAPATTPEPATDAADEPVIPWTRPVLASAGSVSHEPTTLWVRAQQLRGAGLGLTLISAQLPREAGRDGGRLLGEWTGSLHATPYRWGGHILGLRVFGVRADSLAAQSGLQNGDVLVAINGYALGESDGAASSLAQVPSPAWSDSLLVVELNRGGRRLVLAVRWDPTLPAPAVPGRGPVPQPATAVHVRAAPGLAPVRVLRQISSPPPARAVPSARTRR